MTGENLVCVLVKHTLVFAVPEIGGGPNRPPFSDPLVQIYVSACLCISTCKGRHRPERLSRRDLAEEFCETGRFSRF